MTIATRIAAQEDAPALARLNTLFNGCQDTPEQLAARLADPRRVTYQQIRAGGDTVAVIVDPHGVVRWSQRWPDHQEPDYETLLQALRVEPT